VLTSEIVGCVHRERHTGTTVLLRAIMAQAILTDIQMTAACAALSVAWRASGERLLKAVVAIERKCGPIELDGLAQHAALPRAERQKLAPVVVDDPRPCSESRARAPAGRWSGHRRAVRSARQPQIRPETTHASEGNGEVRRRWSGGHGPIRGDAVRRRWSGRNHRRTVTQDRVFVSLETARAGVARNFSERSAETPTNSPAPGSGRRISTTDEGILLVR
jgi:hypothetical protein